MRKLQPYIQTEWFKPEIVKKKSIAAERICQWVLAIDNYYKMSRYVKPKIEK